MMRPLKTLDESQVNVAISLECFAISLADAGMRFTLGVTLSVSYQNLKV